MILDDYMVKAVSTVTAKQLYDSLVKLYADIEFEESDYIPSIEKWLSKLRKKPGLALSTGGRNSYRGVYTCSLLDVIGITNPKAVRNRTKLAWDILESQVGSKILGVVPELEMAKEKRRRFFSGEITAAEYYKDE